jgi:hypothetical protein
MRDTIDMAHKAGFKEHNGMIYVTTINDDCAKELKAFEALVRADEREQFFTPEEARVALEDTDFTWHQVVTQGMVDKLKAIRERSANERARSNT